MKGSRFAPDQAKLVGVAQPDRARLIGFWTSAFEAPGFVSGFDDLAMTDEPTEQRDRHLGVAKDARPFAGARSVVMMMLVRS